MNFDKIKSIFSFTFCSLIVFELNLEIKCVYFILNNIFIRFGQLKDLCPFASNSRDTLNLKIDL